MIYIRTGREIFAVAIAPVLATVLIDPVRRRRRGRAIRLWSAALSASPKSSVDIGHRCRPAGLTSRGGVRDVTLSVGRGEILGIAGLVGSGRTELARTLFGLTPADSGTIRVNGAAIRLTSPADAIRAGIAYVPEDRRQHGVVLALSIAANTSLASLAAVCAAA